MFFFDLVAWVAFQSCIATSMDVVPIPSFRTAWPGGGTKRPRSAGFEWHLPSLAWIHCRFIPSAKWTWHLQKDQFISIFPHIYIQMRSAQNLFGWSQRTHLWWFFVEFSAIVSFQDCLEFPKKRDMFLWIEKLLSSLNHARSKLEICISKRGRLGSMGFPAILANIILPSDKIMKCVFFCRGHIVSLLQFASRFLLLRSCSGQGWKERGRGKVFSAQRRQRKASLPAPIVVFRAFLPVKAVTLCRIGKKKPLCRSLQRRHPKSFLQSLHPCQCLVPRCLLCLPGLPCLCAWSAMWWWKCHVLLLHQLTACPIPATVVTVMMR